MKTIVCTIGTRPEAIKMAPVIVALRHAPWVRCRVVLTGQHRDLVDSVLADWGIQSDVDLDVMKLKLPLDQLARHLVRELSSVLGSPRPDMVLAQGDTTSVLASALASFPADAGERNVAYRIVASRVVVGHRIEAMGG